MVSTRIKSFTAHLWMTVLIVLFYPKTPQLYKDENNPEPETVLGKGSGLNTRISFIFIWY